MPPAEGRQRPPATPGVGGGGRDPPAEPAGARAAHAPRAGVWAEGGRDRGFTPPGCPHSPGEPAPTGERPCALPPQAAGCSAPPRPPPRGRAHSDSCRAARRSCFFFKFFPETTNSSM